MLPPPPLNPLNGGDVSKPFFYPPLTYTFPPPLTHWRSVGEGEKKLIRTIEKKDFPSVYFQTRMVAASRDQQVVVTTEQQNGGDDVDLTEDVTEGGSDEWMNYHILGMIILNSQLIDNSNSVAKLSAGKLNTFAVFIGYWLSSQATQTLEFGDLSDLSQQA
jgi:hypothetical protein